MFSADASLEEIEEPKTIADLLRVMVSFDSVSSGISGRPFAEEQLSLYLERLAIFWGLSTSRQGVSSLVSGSSATNLLVTLTPALTGPLLLFVSHLDTVSHEGMSVDPLKGVIRAGRLYGRGACDTKGSGAAMLWALKEVKRISPQIKNVGLLFTLGEEFDMAGARAVLDSGVPGLTTPPRGIIIGEPTDLRGVIAHNGILAFKLITRGVAAHSSRPTDGRCAIRAMVEAMLFFERRYISRLGRTSEWTGAAVCSLNKISGGTSANVIADCCEVIGDRRLVPGESLDEVWQEIKDTVSEFVSEHPQIELSVELIGGLDSFVQDRNSQFVGAVSAVLDQRGRNAEPVGVLYCTEASLLKNVAPCIVLGPGSIHQAHTTDEWIDLKELESAGTIYRTIMETI